MMRRIETGSSDITNRSGQFLPSVDGINRTQCVTVVLDQPEVVTITEAFDCLKVKWISKSMRQHDCLGLWRICTLQKLRIDVVLRDRHINKNRNRSVLDDRCYGCRETCCNGDDFVSRKDLTFLKKRGSQCHKCEQIRRRTGVYKGTVSYSQIFCKFVFKFTGVTSGCQPEFQRTVHKIYHFF